ncbi:hypothetical protein FrEUN1fDRAFT_4304 [Parafrankia sp. EUN1f]|nr:hypothetical protein FrEUN1fDRAFT_4304 [Parafrankia sp. EUN1f]
MVVGVMASALKELQKEVQKVKHGGGPTKTVHVVRCGLLA